MAPAEPSERRDILLVREAALVPDFALVLRGVLLRFGAAGPDFERVEPDLPRALADFERLALGRLVLPLVARPVDEDFGRPAVVRLFAPRRVVAPLPVFALASKVRLLRPVRLRAALRTPPDIADSAASDPLMLVPSLMSSLSCLFDPVIRGIAGLLKKRANAMKHRKRG